MQVRTVSSVVRTVASFLGFSFAALSSAAPPAYPLQEIIGGDRLLVIDAQHRVWSRQLPINEQRPWALVALPSDAKGAWGISCAPDGSGNCVVGLKIENAGQLGLLARAAKDVVTTGVPARDMFGFVDSSEVYFGRREKDGRTSVHAYDVGRGTERRVGLLAADETASKIMLDGRMTLVARSADGTARTLDHDPPIALPKNLPGDGAYNPRGMILAESWNDSWRSIPQGQNILLVQFVSDGHGQASVHVTSPGSFPLTSPIFDDGSLVGDFEGDLLGTMSGASGRYLVTLCTDRDGLHAHSFASVNRDGAVQLVASPAGNGMIAIETEPGHAPHINVVQFTETSPKGFETRRCDAKLRIDDSGIMSPAAPPNWTVTHGSIEAKDGTPLTYLLLRPNDRTVERLLINVYGAYGSIRNSNSLSPETMDHLLQGNTAIAYVTVRGDGNSGIAAAMISRTPHRQIAVDDLVALTKHLRKLLPSLKVLPTVEGKSAGAWLAMEAALQHPELYAGAIGYSGGYLFADNPSIDSGRNFFGPDDSFDRNGVLDRAKCSQQRFRIVHAWDDPVIGVDQAEQFAQMLKAHGCHGELVTISKGGHGISLERGSPFEKMLVDAYYTAFGPATHAANAPHSSH
jgi:pimeloyl-ACP methyl ester carboxylesterase